LLCLLCFGIEYYFPSSIPFHVCYCHSIDWLVWCLQCSACEMCRHRFPDTKSVHTAWPFSSSVYQCSSSVLRWVYCNGRPVSCHSALHSTEVFFVLNSEEWMYRYFIVYHRCEFDVVLTRNCFCSSVSCAVLILVQWQEEKSACNDSSSGRYILGDRLEN